MSRGGAHFEDLTETTGLPISREAADMMYTRYRVAADLASARRVLELGCGAGQGFGLVGQAASFLVGADYSRKLLSMAKAQYGSRVPLVQLSADSLPFADGSFDLILFFEASYYVPDMGSGFREVTRVLRPGGTVFFVNANPERPDFVRSPHSTHYHSAGEFRAALANAGMVPSVSGAFPVEAGTGGVRSRLVGVLFAAARKTLEAVGLVPRTLRGRARLKRLVYGKLTEVPAELPVGFGATEERTPLTEGPAKGFKVIYVTAIKPGG